MKLLPFQPRPPAGESRESPEHAVGRMLLENLDGLYSTAYRLTGRADAAEDLVQETAHKALRAAASLRDQRNLRAWLFTILVHAIRDHVRRRRRWEESDQQIESAPAGPDLESLSQAAVQDVRDALGRLSPPQRAVVLLVDLEEFTIAEAARMLQAPPGTVASRLARAHQALKGLLRAYGSRSSELGGQP
ncbi:MAG: RNA polymerase sigma factor [Acidobacteria bacterium]|nr:RNA polymerase sigma factor [Acidobacteriota bacterium]